MTNKTYIEIHPAAWFILAWLFVMATIAGLTSILEVLS